MNAPRTNVVSFPYRGRSGKVLEDSRHPEIARASDHWIALRRARTRLQRQERRALSRLHVAIERNLSIEARHGYRATLARDRSATLRRSGDAELLAAEEEMRQLLDEERDLDKDTAERWDRIGELMDLIGSMPPKSLQGCAVKLRFLADEEVGLESGDRDDDVPSLRQVLAFIEDALDSGGPA